MEFTAAAVDDTFDGGKRWQSDFDTNIATQTTTTEQAEQHWQSERRKQLNADLPTQIPASFGPSLKNPHRCKQCGPTTKFPIQH